MSPSHAARYRSHHTDGAGLQTLDLIFAICVHVLIVAVALILGFWHKPVEFHPQSVQVSIISAQQLKKMQRRAHPSAMPKKKKISKPRLRPKPKAKKPALKPPRPRAQPKADPDFDPFKPMSSSSDVKSSSPRRSSKAAEVFAGQLSGQEINHYIAMMQDAVQRHWKVPNVGRDVRDPLVEMTLNPGGSVGSVRVIESSGNEALDASLVRAIQAASPFQVPARQFELFRHNTIRFRPLR